MSKPVTLAIVGATGAVGETLLKILAERNFPVGKLHVLASERSAGSEVHYGAKSLIVRDLATFDPAGVDIALFSAGGSVSKQYAPKFAAAGVVVIDNSSAFRYDDDVPLVVSEVNPEALRKRPRGIIANPNCSTMQMLVALAPIHRAVGIERINVATYQSVSGDESIGVNATVVRVPVFYGHSEAVHIETRIKLSAAAARALLQSAPGVEVVDERTGGGYPTPVTHASGTDPVYVGRIREDISHPRGLSLWVVSDNIRKGAALNAVQLAELVLAESEPAQNLNHNGSALRAGRGDS